MNYDEIKKNYGDEVERDLEAIDKKVIESEKKIFALAFTFAKDVERILLDEFKIEIGKNKEEIQKFAFDTIKNIVVNIKILSVYCKDNDEFKKEFYDFLKKQEHQQKIVKKFQEIGVDKDKIGEHFFDEMSTLLEMAAMGILINT